MDAEARFRQRLRQLIRQRYQSLDRFYLETDFSKGHLSDILRGKGSPSVATLVRLAKALEVEVRDFFVYPERSPRDEAMDLLSAAKPDRVRQVLRLLADDRSPRRG